MNTYEIIKTLANGRKMTVAELERKLNLSTGLSNVDISVFIGILCLYGV